MKIVEVWDPDSGAKYLFAYRVRTICLLLTFCLVPFWFYLPLPAVSIHSALTNVPDHLFLLLYPSALIPAFLHLSSPLITHYLTHSSFCFYPFFFPGSRQSFLCSPVRSSLLDPVSLFSVLRFVLLSWIPSVFSLFSGSFRYKCTFKASRCYFLLLGLKKAHGEHKYPLCS